MSLDSSAGGEMANSFVRFSFPLLSSALCSATEVISLCAFGFISFDTVSFIFVMDLFLKQKLDYHLCSCCPDM